MLGGGGDDLKRIGEEARRKGGRGWEAKGGSPGSVVVGIGLMVMSVRLRKDNMVCLVVVAAYGDGHWKLE